MKLHNSSNISHLTNRKEFYIRYKETNRQIHRRNKSYQHTSTSQYVSSEADLSKAELSVALKPFNNRQQPSSERYPKQRVSAVSPIIFGSLTEAIAEDRYQVCNNAARKKQRQQLPRIPIEYQDEKVHGLLADKQRLRVIYRGYAPKNTFYFFKSLFLGSKSNNTVDPIQRLRNRSEFELEFNSKFESGNLSAAARKSANEYWLYMREDTNTLGLRQWFNFEVFNRRAGKYKFRMYKFTKYYSLYRQGMKPFVWSRHDTEWHQEGQNVKYEWDSESKCYYLQFEYQFKEQYIVTKFATQPPYTYTMLKKYISLLKDKHSDVIIESVGRSLSGLQIPKITLRGKDKGKKSVIMIIARTHPAQVSSSYALESFINIILQKGTLLKEYNFHIIPMVNPDGVFLGNHRTGIMGQDFNRNFNCQNLQFFPEISAVITVIQKIKKTQEIKFLLDLHGHSARRNIFAYGQDYYPGSEDFLNTHILPKILSDSLSSFKYNYCIFRASKTKKNCARIFLNKKYRIKSLTFQESYGLIENGQIGVIHWRNFGAALADALLSYNDNFGNGDIQKMTAYLSNQIEQKQIIYKKRLKRKIQMLSSAPKEEVQAMQENPYKFKTEVPCEIFQNTVEEKAIKKPQVQTDAFQDKQSSLDSALSSGDLSLENNEEGMETLRKQINRISCLKERSKREQLSLANKKIEIRGDYKQKMHGQKSSMTPKLIQYQYKKRGQTKVHDSSFIFDKSLLEYTRKSSRLTQHAERQGIQLPYLRK